jgi:DDE superfamily endonuclease
VVDSRYKILYASARCAGATHDNLAFAVSTLNTRLWAGDLEVGFWIAADKAYTYTESLITPWPGAELGDDLKKAFIFFHSSLRMRMEQSFSQINSRFGILWRPLKFRLEKIPTIIHSAFLLHNFCIDNMEPAISMEAIQQAKMASKFSDW